MLEKKRALASKKRQTPACATKSPNPPHPPRYILWIPGCRRSDPTIKRPHSLLPMRVCGVWKSAAATYRRPSPNIPVDHYFPSKHGKQMEKGRFFPRSWTCVPSPQTRTNESDERRMQELSSLCCPSPSHEKATSRRGRFGTRIP